MPKNKTIILMAAIVAAGFYCRMSVAQVDKEGGPVMKLTSPAFKDKKDIPSKFTGEGEDVNPALDIENIPAGTKSLALIVDDPDAPGKTWVHWVVYDIPPTNHIVEDSVPGKQGMNDSHGVVYHGPYPPSGTHRYYFKLYALDKVLGLAEGISKAELEKAMKGSILSSAELMGTYERKMNKR